MTTQEKAEMALREAISKVHDEYHDKMMEECEDRDVTRFDILCEEMLNMVILMY